MYFGNDTETTAQFFLFYPSFYTLRQTLLNNIRNIEEQILSHGEYQLIQTFLYANTKHYLPPPLSPFLTLFVLVSCNISSDTIYDHRSHSLCIDFISVSKLGNQD